jgi:class 3 adenylate cyclase
MQISRHDGGGPVVAHRPGTATSTTGQRPGRPNGLPVTVWLMHVMLPLLGLWLLIAQPQLDGVWEDPGSHFWLVGTSAVLSLTLGARVRWQARRHEDTRLVLVSLAFMVVAGFLGLHAVATPGVLIARMNAGFMVATPVGLFVAGILSVLSTLELSGRAGRWAVHSRGAAWLAATVVLLSAALLTSVSVSSPTGYFHGGTEAYGSLLKWLAVVGSGFYGLAGARYFRLHRRRPSAVLVSVITSYVLLAEALVAIAYSRNWHASWWEWHVLLLVAVGFVAYSAHTQYHKEGSRAGLFNGVAMAQTVQQIREEYAAALEAMVDAIDSGATSARLRQVTATLAAQFGITEGQAAVLEEGAAALARERAQLRRLEALVEVGLQANLGCTEERLLRTAVDLIRDGFGEDRVGIAMLRAGKLRHVGQHQLEAAHPEAAALRTVSLTGNVAGESDAHDYLALPLGSRNTVAGVLESHRPSGEFTDQDRSVLRLLAHQLSIAIDNARVHRQLDELFRSYLSPDVARTLLADPSQAELGGAIVDVTVLMADLVGFTPFSEATTPADVVEMLNTYYGRIVPCILRNGGTVLQFVGDAIVALFNSPVQQADHAMSAARAGLELHLAVSQVARPGWPPFRVGINTGPALVGNIGSSSMRHFTAVGDTINLAARLESIATPGTVVIGAGTRAALGSRAVVESLGSVTVKGKSEPVEAFGLHSL